MDPTYEQLEALKNEARKIGIPVVCVGIKF